MHFYIDLNATRSLVEIYKSVDFIFCEFSGPFFSAIYNKSKILILDHDNRKNFHDKIDEILRQYINYYRIDKNDNVEKIAAIGIRVKKWVAFHGFSLNLNVNKKDYNGIIPCGIQDKGIANISDFLDLKLTTDINDVIISEFKKIFPDMS